MFFCDLMYAFVICVYGVCMLLLYSKIVSTHLWNTPLNLYQRAIKGFFSWLAREIAWGVL